MNETGWLSAKEYKIKYALLLEKFIAESSKTELDFLEKELSTYTPEIFTINGIDVSVVLGKTDEEKINDKIIKFIRVKIAECKYGKLEENSKEVVDLEKLVKKDIPFFFMNEDAYRCFCEYTEKYMLDFYIDYSYLKKRLSKEELIKNITDNYFMQFMFEDLKIISNKNYDNYLKVGKLYSLSKSRSSQRENSFNVTFKLLIK